VPPEVVRVHGLTNEFLADKPVFSSSEVVEELLEFIGDAPLIAHNAEFDRRFLNAELARLNLPLIDKNRCIDTLMIARKKFPGAPATLDALCRRFNVDLSNRKLHGALKDSLLLAEVYLQLKGGRERRLSFLDPAKQDAQEATPKSGVLEATGVTAPRQRPSPLALASTQEERQAHANFVLALGGGGYEPAWRAILD
jgi:DNA polymerase III subunit epsilon